MLEIKVSGKVENQTRRPGYAGHIWMNHGKPGYKGHKIDFMVDFIDHLGLFGNIEDHLRPY